MQILAHRGLRARRPENTLLAFREAWRAGADGIELDVQLTLDGVPVILHDETLERTTSGSGPVNALTLAQLCRLDAGAGERVPTLEEYLDWAAPLSLVTNIELKNNRVTYPGLEEKTIESVQKRGMGERVVLSSFNHASVRECRRLAPEIPTGLLFWKTAAPPAMLAAWRDVGANFLHPCEESLTPDALDALEAAAAPLYVWSLRPVWPLERLAGRKNIRGVIVDDPAWAKDVWDASK